MKVFAALAACFILCGSAALAQISVRTDDGRQVTIGQNGITINSVNAIRRAKVKLGYGGIQVESKKPLRHSQVKVKTSQKAHSSMTQTAQAPVAYVKESVSYQPTANSYQVAAVAVAGPQLTDMVINENNQVIKGNCNGNAIIVNGNNCELQLSGKLGLVTINGNRNRVQSEQIGLVIANGNSNNVTWSHPQGAPLVTNNGRDNSMHAQQ
jgi:hypothetical protein